MTALAVILIACPCALGVATPLALWAALGRASRHGVLYRDGDALTQLAEAKVVAFDKTGTMTTGVTVADVWPSDEADLPTRLASGLRGCCAPLHNQAA